MLFCLRIKDQLLVLMKGRALHYVERLGSEDQETQLSVKLKLLIFFNVTTKCKIEVPVICFRVMYVKNKCKN